MVKLPLKGSQIDKSSNSQDPKNTLLHLREKLVHMF